MNKITTFYNKNVNVNLCTQAFLVCELVLWQKIKNKAFKNNIKIMKCNIMYSLYDCSVWNLKKIISRQFFTTSPYPVNYVYKTTLKYK